MIERRVDGSLSECGFELIAGRFILQHLDEASRILRSKDVPQDVP
jgi:hypothetical protein